jgi:Emfourin
VKISYREAGGFAGLRRGADLDLESLPPAEASRLRKLVERARLGDLEARGPSTARDLVGYEIVVEGDDGKTVVARFDDATAPASATALLDALQKRARPIPPLKTSSPAGRGRT